MYLSVFKKIYCAKEVQLSLSKLLTKWTPEGLNWFVTKLFLFGFQEEILINLVIEQMINDSDPGELFWSAFSDVVLL